MIHLPEAEYLMFHGQPFREEDYCEAISPGILTLSLPSVGIFKPPMRQA